MREMPVRICFGALSALALALVAPTAASGDGRRGRLEPYDEPAELKSLMSRYGGMSAGWYRREHVPAADGAATAAKCYPVDALPYLLVRPKRGTRPVPMVVYFGGTGEHGTNLVRQFNQPLVFERLSAPKFQAENPCYVFAPMLPKGGVIRHAMPAGASPLADLVCEAMSAVVASLNDPPVDTNRLYLTGLSWGGVAAFELSCGYPGRFAAAVPVSCIQTPLRIPPEKPGNYWMLYNESSFRSDGSRWAIREMERIVRAGGGDFRSSTFPDLRTRPGRGCSRGPPTAALPGASASRAARLATPCRAPALSARQASPASTSGIAPSMARTDWTRRATSRRGRRRAATGGWSSSRPRCRGA